MAELNMSLILIYTVIIGLLIGIASNFLWNYLWNRLDTRIKEFLIHREIEKAYIENNAGALKNLHLLYAINKLRSNNNISKSLGLSQLYQIGVYANQIEYRMVMEALIDAAGKEQDIMIKQAIIEAIIKLKGKSYELNKENTKG